MGLRQGEGGKQQTAELRASAIAPPAVLRCPFAAPAIAVTPIAGMTNAKTWLGRRRGRELNNHMYSMV
jgi:hypothetical protein